MNGAPDEFPTPPPARLRRRRRPGWTLRLTPLGSLLLLLLNLVIVGGLALGINRLQGNASPAVSMAAQVTLTASDTPSPSPLPSTPTDTPPTPTPPEPPASPYPVTNLHQGLILLALVEGGNTHLFAYQPLEEGAGQSLPLARLTDGPWDDATPAISPDGQSVAFASNRSGYWDLYLLDLTSGAVERLTDSQAYDSAPAWSPDGQWLVYESYLDDNLELMIQPVRGRGQVMRLTSDPAADHSPAWSPAGRSIAFISNRSGESQVWLADLDQSEAQRFQNISQEPGAAHAHPAWSPDGNAIAWANQQDGFHNLIIQELKSGERHIAGSGDWPAWGSDGQTLLSVVLAPNRAYLTAYPTHTSGLALPPLALPGPVNGLSWGIASLTWPLRDPFRQAALLTPTPAWLPDLNALPDETGGRYQLVSLGDVEAPHPFMHDLVNESFQALRSQVGQAAGWDVLASLENAYVPLTSPLEPGMGNDWLYTGRAFAFNPLPMDAGWVMAVRQDFGAETYWRIYVRARFQDGSAGIPLHDQPWDLSARLSGDPDVYEQGGALLSSAPPGYWVDFTQLAVSFGWQRMPALSTWRASYSAARFNEFAFTMGMEWYAAMLELYPPEALITPSPVVPPTRTLTPTPRWYQSPTPTQTPTPRPTLTPLPATPTFTATSTPPRLPARTLTPTPSPSATPAR